MIRLRHTIAVFFGLISICNASSADTVSIQVSSVYPWRFLTAGVTVYADKKASTAFRNIKSDTSELTIADYFDIPLKETKYPHYFSFRLHNDKGEAVSFYLYNYIGGATDVHQVDENGESVSKVEPQEVRSTLILHQVFKITVASYATVNYSVRVQPLRDPRQAIYCWLIPASQIDDFFIFSSGFSWLDNTVGWIVSGMLLMMLLYISIKYWQVGSAVYFYYAGYIFFFFLFFTLKNISDWNTALRNTPFYYTFGYQMLQIAAYCMYFPFAQRFINTKTTIPKLHPWLTRIVWALLLYIVVDFILLFIPSAMMFRWRLWT